MKKIYVSAATAVACATLAFAGLASCSSSIMKRAVNRSVDSAMESRGTAYFNDGGIHVFLAGTGTPMAVKGRAGACAVVVAADQFYMVDAGAGSWANIALEGLPAERLSGILLTHYHSDHITEAGEAAIQSWIKGRKDGPLDVYGPEGVVTISNGFNMVYSLDRWYRTAHHGGKHMPPESGLLRPQTITFDPETKSAVMLEKNGLRVTAFLVDHAPVEPACGFRFDYRGKSVVISGDTRKNENVLVHSKNADLLIHEVAAKHLAELAVARMRETGHARLAAMTAEAESYHTTAREAAEIARKAGVSKLVFTHIAPSLSPSVPGCIIRYFFFNGMGTGFDGPVVFGEDGMWFHVK